MTRKILIFSVLSIFFCTLIFCGCNANKASIDSEKDSGVISDEDSGDSDAVSDENSGENSGAISGENSGDSGMISGEESGAVSVYELASVHAVNGRQGVCVEGDYYWVSGSTTLTKYDRDWNLVAENTDPFKGYDLEVNHIGDIDVYQNELYLGVEYFMDGEGKNIQVAVYDGDTLELKRVFPFRSDTGQLECSGIAVDPDSKTVYMSSWIDDASSDYLYMYDLETGDYRGKLQMRPAPKWLQGVAYYDGNLYVTGDDGDADENAPDHMYKIEISDDRQTGSVILEKTFDDVILQGEIEGLTFDAENGEFLLLYNRGAKIKAGMPVGFYDGYDQEIHEVFVYQIK